jgi:hypothetical protein
MGFADQVKAFAEQAQARIAAAEALTREMNGYAPPLSVDEVSALRVRARAWIDAEPSLANDEEGREKLCEVAEAHLLTLAQRSSVQ